MQIQNNNYITNEKLDYLHKEKNNFEKVKPRRDKKTTNNKDFLKQRKKMYKKY